MSGLKGSSPLARGLRRADRRPGREPVDHPRSRGVYPERIDQRRRPHGSSPLARGLLFMTGVRVDLGRIIPARAGFTMRPIITSAFQKDHPRSRGVYQECESCDDDDSGSSPLARGLRDSGTRGLVCPRIIPARAGFTYFAQKAIDEPGDHPRSRGVYKIAGENVDNVEGSSPLARGLREYRCRGVGGRRIIPARAGFTGRDGVGRP